MPIKLGIEKAYDMLDRTFNKTCLLDIGSSDKWTKWIMEWTTSLTMLINGKPGNP